MLFAPKEKGQGLLTFVIILGVVVWIVVEILRVIKSLKETGKFPKEY